MTKSRTKGSVHPFSRYLSWSDFSFDSYDIKVQRNLSEVPHIYSDTKAVNEILSENDRLLYLVYTTAPSEESGELCFDSVVIYPGVIGNEYHMTKGHHHKGKGAEIYSGLQGEGYILLQSRRGQFVPIKFGKGVVAYIPSGWAHRTVNTGNNLLCFFGVYPSGLVHDYTSVEKTGFSKIVVAKNGKPEIIDNPLYNK